jgi:hypothetical protein
MHMLVREPLETGEVVEAVASLAEHDVFDANSRRVRNASAVFLGSQQWKLPWYRKPTRLESNRPDGLG